MKLLLTGVLLGCLVLVFCGIGIGAEKPELKGKFVASVILKKYHYPRCKRAKRINPANLVVFNTPEEAVAAGYIPCNLCKPPTKSGE